MELVTSSLLWPRMWGRRLCLGSWEVGACGGETGICLCSAMQDWYLCLLQSDGHCGAGTVLTLCGQAWPDDGVGSTPLEVPEMYMIGTTCSEYIYRPGSGEGRAQEGNLLSLYLTSPVFQGYGTVWDAWRMMDDAGRDKPPYQACYPAEEGLDSLYLVMPMLQPQGHSHVWMRWAPSMLELLYLQHEQGQP